MGNGEQGSVTQNTDIQNAGAQTGVGPRDPLDVVPADVAPVDAGVGDVPATPVAEKIVSSNIRDDAANVVIATAAATEIMVTRSGFGFQSDELQTRALRDETPDTGLGQYDDPVGPIDPTLRGYQGIILPPLYAPVHLYDTGQTITTTPAPAPLPIVHNLVGGADDDFFMGLIHGIHNGDFYVYMDHDGLLYRPQGFINIPVEMPVMDSGFTTDTIDPRLIEWDGIYNVNSGGGNDTIFMITDDAVIDAGAGYNWIGVVGNNNRVLSGDDGDRVHIAGVGNVILAGDGNNEIWILGDGNNLQSGFDGDYIMVSGNGNTISGGGGDDDVTLAGDDNIIYAGDAGRSEYHLSGDGNLIYGADSRDVFDFASVDTGTSYFYDFTFDGFLADSLNLVDILERRDTLDEALADLYLVNVAEGTELYVRGNGDATFSHLATFIGGTGGYDLHDLVYDGIIIVNTPPV